MKNSEEFRRTVFEKAEQYQREEKRRRRKICESALICSICLVIGFTAFLGFWFGNIKGMETPELETTAAFPPVSGDAEVTSGESSADMNATMETRPESTQTGVMSSPVFTTADGTVTVTTTIAETTVRPEGVTSEFSLASDGDAAVKETAQIVLHNKVEFERYLSDLDSVYHISHTTIETLERRYDDAFFAENSLLVVRTSGYGYCQVSGFYSASGVLTLKFSEMANEERGLIYQYLIPVKKTSEEQITVNFHFVSG